MFGQSQNELGILVRPAHPLTQFSLESNQLERSLDIISGVAIFHQYFK